MGGGGGATHFPPRAKTAKKRGRQEAKNAAKKDLKALKKDMEKLVNRGVHPKKPEQRKTFSKLRGKKKKRGGTPTVGRRKKLSAGTRRDAVGFGQPEGKNHWGKRKRTFSGLGAKKNHRRN